MQYSVFAKAHDVSDEPRDERGRWSVSAGMKALKDFAARAVPQIHRGKLTAVRPVQGGGLQLTFTAPTANGELTSHVQVLPSHVQHLKGMSHALDIAHRALSSYGIQPAPRLPAIAHGIVAGGKYQPSAPTVQQVPPAGQSFRPWHYQKSVALFEKMMEPAK